MKTSRRPKLNSRWPSLSVQEIRGFITLFPKFVVNDVQIDAKSRASARLWLRNHWR